jgi:hypothetical protein
MVHPEDSVTGDLTEENCTFRVALDGLLCYNSYNLADAESKTYIPELALQKVASFKLQCKSYIANRTTCQKLAQLSGVMINVGITRGYRNESHSVKVVIRKLRCR